MNCLESWSRNIINGSKLYADWPVLISWLKNGYSLQQKSVLKRPKHELITSHRAISTFITHAVENKVPLNIISSITGKTTKIILSR